jgi:hypothetical protein
MDFLSYRSLEEKAEGTEAGGEKWTICEVEVPLSCVVQAVNCKWDVFDPIGSCLCF